MDIILILDSNRRFLSDLEGRLLLDAPDDIDFVLSSDFDDIEGQIREEDVSMVVFNMEDYDTFLDLDFMKKIKTVSYAKNSDQLMHSQREGIPSFGIIVKTRGLIQKIAENDIMYFDEENEHEEEFENDVSEEFSSDEVLEPEENFDSDEDPFQKEEEANESFDDEDSFDSEDIFDDFEEEAPKRNRRVVHNREPEKKQEERINRRREKSVEPKSVAKRPESEPEEKQPKKKRRNTENKSKKRMDKIKKIDEKEKRESQLSKRLNQELKKDLNLEKDPAKIITVYSAKGGVGKTTIACELATALALTDHGRGKMSVCIVDYNIDFGDVLTTLDYSPKKTCMSYWASDIREILAGNNDPVYSQAEIRKQFLQKNEESGLYALLAPFTNEDSMEINEEELRIMLENLRDYGGFDYIICDTGNNTRDSSYIALEMADQVIMILTQNVNTVNCNDSFLSTMQKIHFNMDKFSIVINKIRPSKLVEVGTEEIEAAFLNPATRKPYECLAKIKDTTDAMKANNMGRPLVYDSNHEFTKQIRGIIAKVAGEQYVLSMPEAKKKKKGLFGLFRK